MAADGVPDHLLQFFQSVSLGVNGMAQGLRLVTALRRLLYGEDDLGFSHPEPLHELYGLGLSYSKQKAPGSRASSPGAPKLAGQYNDDRLPLTDDGSTAFGQSSELVARSRNLGNTLGGFRPGVN